MFKKLLLTASALVLTAVPAFAQDSGVSTADLPRTMASPLRLTPVVGASSFTTNNTVDVTNFNEGISAGLLADIGSGFWTFETGILTLQSNVDRTGDTGAINVDTWGVPLLAKVNFSGMPHSTVFAKLGAMPFTATGDADDFDIMAVGGIGGALPLGRNSSLIIDATYNRLFTTGGDLTNYQGVSLLAGLSLNI